MRQVADASRIWNFMRALGAEADEEARLYFTGGATAVLFGWRRSTIDVDINPASSAVGRSDPGARNLRTCEKIRTAPVRARAENLTRFAEIFSKLLPVRSIFRRRRLTDILPARPYGRGSEFFTGSDGRGTDFVLTLDVQDLRSTDLRSLDLRLSTCDLRLKP